MKKLVKGFFRFFGLMKMADTLRYQLIRKQNRAKNKQFLEDYPSVILPPDYLMYESFGLDYYRYFVNGKKTAEWLLEQIEPFQTEKVIKVLDWGCGPARVIRHFPNLLPANSLCYGTDYNAESIDWCQSNIDGIEFGKNKLMPPLDLGPNQFDFVYGISIFTHLSEEAHHAWMKELGRVLKPGGILLLTLHGDAFISKLGSAEKNIYEAGELVARGQTVEGHRTFIAYHPPSWVKTWSKTLTLLSHQPGSLEKGKEDQDVWIFRKDLED